MWNPCHMGLPSKRLPEPLPGQGLLVQKAASTGQLPGSYIQIAPHPPSLHLKRLTGPPLSPKKEVRKSFPHMNLTCWNFTC